MLASVIRPGIPVRGFERGEGGLVARELPRSLTPEAFFRGYLENAKTKVERGREKGLNDSRGRGRSFKRVGRS